jgi:hypothetical protein
MLSFKETSHDKRRSSSLPRRRSGSFVQDPVPEHESLRLDAATHLLNFWCSHRSLHE